MKKIISIANDFSVYPGGRTPDDGPFSGEEFRNKFLMPALKNKEHLVINFDGVRGYGSSFLEEAFGGLVRQGFIPVYIYKYFELNSSRASLIEEVKSYIDKAAS